MRAADRRRVEKRARRARRDRPMHRRSDAELQKLLAEIKEAEREVALERCAGCGDELKLFEAQIVRPWAVPVSIVLADGRAHHYPPLPVPMIFHRGCQ